MNKDIRHIQTILRHIKHVQDNCQTLGERLIEHGEFQLGRALIANSMIHDYSKFFGMEFVSLRPNNKDSDSLRAAVMQHNQTNPHHPEYWGKIENMPDIYLSECICDWKARSGEFGSSLIEWIDNEASQRFGFTKDSLVYTRIMKFLKMLLDEPFKQPKKTKPITVVMED